ncbi:uncharacterized protein LDX57_003294 [Aspergillus melleus]|uniref:uncharacterized protein n=1 Tax=Aspergillus melleus TaxID=138277 RepID=UPI001E8D8290|nr:uncharacterized protein LDX57_003294 [Aspergillus melleus]KAH8425543.1 hypothetical protein LDX57_003294 [Aspergillus melleus]
MFCPNCHPNHIYVEASIPMTRFQINEIHVAMASDPKFLSLTTFDQAQLKLAQHLSAILPHECRHSFKACRIAALKAYAGMKAPMTPMKSTPELTLALALTIHTRQAHGLRSQVLGRRANELLDQLLCADALLYIDPQSRIRLLREG